MGEKLDCNTYRKRLPGEQDQPAEKATQLGLLCRHEEPHVDLIHTASLTHELQARAIPLQHVALYALAFGLLLCSDLKQAGEVNLAGLMLWSFTNAMERSFV